MTTGNPFPLEEEEEGPYDTYVNVPDQIIRSGEYDYENSDIYNTTSFHDEKQEVHTLIPDLNGFYDFMFCEKCSLCLEEGIENHVCGERVGDDEKAYEKWVDHPCNRLRGQPLTTLVFSYRHVYSCNDHFRPYYEAIE